MRLRSRLIRLAHAEPHLRKALLPILAKQSVTVYRFNAKGRPERDLDNRNAGNLMGVVAHMDKFADDYKIQFAAPKGTVTEYEVAVEGSFGPYTPFVSGRPRGGGPANLSSVGRGEKSGMIWYSFPEDCGCWRVKRVGKTVPVTDLPMDWGRMGWTDQERVLERMF
jgi:hypothetical protein